MEKPCNNINCKKEVLKGPYSIILKLPLLTWMLQQEASTSVTFPLDCHQGGYAIPPPSRL